MAHSRYKLFDELGTLEFRGNYTDDSGNKWNLVCSSNIVNGCNTWKMRRCKDGDCSEMIIKQHMGI